MNLNNELLKDDQTLRKMPKAEQDPYEDEGTQMYAERPAFVALDTQETVFDQGSLNKQYGINTQPSIFYSTWK